MPTPVPLQQAVSGKPNRDPGARQPNVGSTTSLAHSAIRPTGAQPSAAPGAPGIPGASDPGYLAYMREMGVQESTLNSLTGFRVNALTRQLGRALPAYAEKRENAIEDTGLSYEDRGLYRSGIRMDAQAEAGRAVDRERLDFEAGIRDQIGELYVMNAVDIAELRRQLMEEGLTAAQANAIANAQAGI